MTKDKTPPGPRCAVISRRHLLENVSAAGAMVGLGAVVFRLAASTALAHPRLIRPPGGQGEAHFAALCLKCNRCEEICPTHVIASAHLQDGLLEARTPQLDFTIGYCNFCMDCIAVCPTQALLPVDKAAAKIGLALIRKDQCIPWQWGGCTLCYEKCPEKAVLLDDQKRPVIDDAKCNGCGLCELICPATKLRSYQVGQTRGVTIESPRSGGAAEAKT